MRALMMWESAAGVSGCTRAARCLQGVRSRAGTQVRGSVWIKLFGCQGFRADGGDGTAGMGGDGQPSRSHSIAGCSS